MKYDCGNCNHHWQAEQHQECCPQCNSWHVMTTDEWSTVDAYTEDLTPEGIQLVVPGAERIIEPTKRDPQGNLW